MASRTDVVNGSGDEGSQPTLPAPPRVAGPGLKLRTEDEVVFAELLEEAIDSLPRKIKGEAFFRAPVFLGCLSRMRMADAHLVLAQLAPPMDEEMEELVAYAWPSALVSEPLVRLLLDVLHRHHEGYSSDDSDGSLPALIANLGSSEAETDLDEDATGGMHEAGREEDAGVQQTEEEEETEKAVPLPPACSASTSAALPAPVDSVSGEVVAATHAGGGCEEAAGGLKKKKKRGGKKRRKKKKTEGQEAARGPELASDGVEDGARQSSVAAPAPATPAAPPPAVAAAALAAPRVAADSRGPSAPEPSPRLTRALQGRIALIERVAEEITYSRSLQRGVVPGGIELLASSDEERTRLSLEAFVRRDLDMALKIMLEDAAPEEDLSTAEGAAELRQSVELTLDYLMVTLTTMGALRHLWRTRSKAAVPHEPSPEELHALEDEIVLEGQIARGR